MRNKTKKRRRTFMRYMAETYKNKLLAILLFIAGMTVVYLDNDGTFLVIALLFGIPLFFAKENCLF